MITNWRKPSRSFSNGQCVEVGQDAAAVGVRDSKDCEAGPVLTFGGEAWAAFTGQLKAGGGNTARLASAGLLATLGLPSRPISV